jgi:hypothetical protein
MRFLTLVAAGGLAAVTLAGCHTAGDPRARTRLDCPASAGKLSRMEMSADGRACRYADNAGDEVDLRLAAVPAGPDAALTPVEQSLRAQFGLPLAKPATGDDADSEDDEEGNQAHGADKTGGKSGDADISLPGIRVIAHGDKAEVNVGAIHVDAGGGGAVVRNARQVKMRGNPFVLAREGYRASYMISREAPADGFELVGYEAGGPQAGPLTVAVVKARGHHNGVFAEARKLVGRNGGV